MKIDWSIVKKHTLWDYEELIAKLQNVLAYSFVQEYYNHTFSQAKRYANKIRNGYLQNRGDKVAFIDNILASLEKYEKLGIKNYSDLICQVVTREQCITFLKKTDFNHYQLIQTLNYLLRWVLPFKTPIREFINMDSAIEMKYLVSLKKQKIGSNLDIIDLGKDKEGRKTLSKITEIPINYILSLVHKADISRLAYVRGKTVFHLCGCGYDTLEKLATANMTEMEVKMEAYYKTFGKSLSEFKAVIPLSWMVGGAKILPHVVKI
jgi:hypothetical protein